MTEQQAEQAQAPDFLEQAAKECRETVIQMAGVGGAESAGSLAGLMIAVFRELFERLAIVERALMALTGVMESANGEARVAPADDEFTEIREIMEQVAPLPVAPPPSPPPPFYPISSSPIAEPARHTADSISILQPASEVRLRQAASVPVQTQMALAPETQAPPPPPIAENPEIAALEARLASLRARRQATTAATMPAAAKLRYEVRHAEGSLVGKPGVLQALVTHDTPEQAAQAITIIEADHPGWRGRLAVHEVME